MSAAGPLLLTPRLRPRSGPALRPAPLPVTATLLSAITHGALAGDHDRGRPRVRARPAEDVHRQSRAGGGRRRLAAGSYARCRRAPRSRRPASPRALRASCRSARRRAPAPAPPPDLPARSPSLPELPARTPALPERATPPRPAPAPRAGDKELPPIASAATPPAPAPTPPAPAPSVTSRAEPPAPPAPALGRPSGSAQGSGAVTLNVSDFPFAWYLAAVQRKVTERWEGRALQGRQPVVTFEIARDGQVSNVAIKDSSGNRVLRPSPRCARSPRRRRSRTLPDEFPGSVLRVHMGFNFAQDRG